MSLNLQHLSCFVNLLFDVIHAFLTDVGMRFVIV